MDTLKPAMDALKADVSKPLARATLKLVMDALKNTIDLIEANGDSVGGDAPCCPTKARTRKKRAAPKREPIRRAILNDLETGKTTPEELNALDRKTLGARYGEGAVRTTVVDALNEACRDFESRQIPTNDKS